MASQDKILRRRLRCPCRAWRRWVSCISTWLKLIMKVLRIPAAFSIAVPCIVSDMLLRFNMVRPYIFCGTRFLSARSLLIATTTWVKYFYQLKNSVTSLISLLLIVSCLACDIDTTLLVVCFSLEISAGIMKENGTRHRRGTQEKKNRLQALLMFLSTFTLVKII